jgi:uncharacterized protein YndB with AHSA1/START domain
MKLSVQTTVKAPIETVWRFYTSPEHILQWNAASDDWHTTTASVELREGGTFSSRMEAKDGSFGFDFAGVYTKIIIQERLEYSFGDRTAAVTFTPSAEGVLVQVTFDAETEHTEAEQIEGWQAILNRFAKHTEKKLIGVRSILFANCGRSALLKNSAIDPLPNAFTSGHAAVAVQCL